MMEKNKNRCIVILTACILYGFLIGSIVMKDKDISLTERRPLTQFPKLTGETVMQGEFMADFEKYALDQFPLRDAFRMTKMLTSFYVLGQKDNNGIYAKEGYAVKLEYPMDRDSLDYAASRFTYVYDTFLKDHTGDIYLSVIPDKNMLMGEKYGYPVMDYESLTSHMREKMAYAKFIDLQSKLDISDYYRTDIHWRQESLQPVATYLAKEMGVELTASYEEKKADRLFYGVYAGQTAPEIPGDELRFLTNDMLEQCTVYDFETNKTFPVYNMELAAGEDPYGMFLSGSKSLLTLENPQATSEKELIVFRDSFGSSLMPLLAEGYKKITLVDIRYLNPMFLGKFITFEGQDVLFLYSTPVLNNSVTIK